jgi:hypothetical protein
MNKLIMATMFALGLGASSVSTQTISDRLNDPSRTPGSPVVVGMVGEPIPLSVEELTKRSDLILEGKVSTPRSYINSADTAVITDYRVLPIRVLGGTAPAVTDRPGIAGGLVVSVYGGEVVRNGVTIRAENHDLRPLKEGGSYLLFLKHFGKESGAYEIYNAGAFDISDDRVRPLASHGADLYKDFSNATHNDVVGRVIAAARLR